MLHKKINFAPCISKIDKEFQREFQFASFLVISVINKEHVLDIKCFECFQFISQLFVHI